MNRIGIIGAGIAGLGVAAGALAYEESRPTSAMLAADPALHGPSRKDATGAACSIAPFAALGAIGASFLMKPGAARTAALVGTLTAGAATLIGSAAYAGWREGQGLL